MKNIKVYMKGLDKHELVQIEILDLPKTIRKITGMALDENQAKFFEMLGFEKEAEFKGYNGVYCFYPKKCV